MPVATQTLTTAPAEPAYAAAPASLVGAASRLLAA